MRCVFGIALTNELPVNTQYNSPLPGPCDADGCERRGPPGARWLIVLVCAVAAYNENIDCMDSCIVITIAVVTCAAALQAT